MWETRDYRSDNSGGNWTSLNKGLCITEVEYLAARPEHDAWLIAGTQDNGTMRYEGSVVWDALSAGGALSSQEYTGDDGS